MKTLPCIKTHTGGLRPMFSVKNLPGLHEFEDDDDGITYIIYTHVEDDRGCFNDITISEPL